MSKTNFFTKYLKNTSLFINSLLEKNLNKLNFKNLSNLFKNNKIILTFVALFVIFISYLLSPTFFQQSDISNELKNKLQNKLDLKFKFSNNFKYNFFPRPHFITDDTAIFDGNSEISKIKKLKIFLSFDNLFSLKKIKINNLIFENANFNLNKKNYNFILQLLNKSFEDGNLLIKDSNIFFRDSKSDVLFVIKILNMKYYYDSKETKNILYTESEIFNIPFSIQSFFNEDKSKILSNIDLNLLRLRIENELSIKNEKKIGKTEFIFNKLKRITEYQIEKNYFKFHMYDKKDEPSLTFKGIFNLKPFYASLEGKLDQINLNHLFSPNAIIAQLLKTEILNNKNIVFNLKINANKLYKYSSFRNINLVSKIQDGLIDTDKSKFEWRDSADFELLESLVFVRDGELVLDGKLKININNYNEIYKFLLTPKNYRKKISQIDLNFTYNFDQTTAELKDIRIDNKINLNIDKTLNNIVLKKDKIQNKIYFKKILNEVIKSYAG